MQTLHGQFQAELHQAIDRYIKENPFRARSVHRQKDIKALRNIIDTSSSDSLVNDLLSHFASDDYYTGTLDRSRLEDLVFKCILDHDASLKSAFEHFGPIDLPQTTPSTTPCLAPQESKEEITYSFNDYIEFAINKYSEEKSGNLPAHRVRSEKYINSILVDAALGDEQKIKKIKDYFDGKDPLAPFEKSFCSSFRQYVLESIEYYNFYKGTPKRQVNTLTWPVVQPKGIMLFLHGWRDNLDTAAPLARLAQQAGFEVITYDHRGHGNDDERHPPRTSNITGDLFRLDFEKFLDKIHEKYPGQPIALVGNSLGGAILAASRDKIQKIAKEKNQVKNVTLLSPAITSNIINLARPDRKLYRTAHPELKKLYHKTNRTPGKTGAKTFRIMPNLLIFMRQAFHALARLFQSKAELTIPYLICTGEQDYYLIHHQIEKLKKTYGEHTNLQTKFFRHEDHTFLLSRHHRVIVPRILAEIEKGFASSAPAPTDDRQQATVAAL